MTEKEAPGYTAHLLMGSVDAVRQLYADMGISALMPDAENIIEAWMELGHIVGAIKIAMNQEKAA